MPLSKELINTRPAAFTFNLSLLAVTILISLAAGLNRPAVVVVPKYKLGSDVVPMVKPSAPNIKSPALLTGVYPR